MKQQPLVRPELERLRSETRRLHAEAEAIKETVWTGAMSALERAWQCGKRLNEMKSIIGHGNWLTYLQSQLPEISESTAQRYMKINFQKTAFQRAVRHRTLLLERAFQCVNLLDGMRRVE